ncbi:TRI27 protein, partial [Alopecoenas beccarii]|nr:TRI27 protein [Alopecoenas beccarii]
ARVLEIAKELSSEATGAAMEEEEEEEEEEGCEKHREPLGFFCKDDGVGVCAVCRESRAHRSHAVLPVQDALQEYEGQIQARLQDLKDKRDKLLGFREAEMRRSW